MPSMYKEEIASRIHEKLLGVKFSSLNTKRIEMKIQKLDAKAMYTDSIQIINKNEQNKMDSFGNNRYIIADLRETLLKRIIDEEKFSLAIEDIFNKLKSSQERTVLKMYYLDGRTISEIAAELFYSTRHVVRIKKEGLNNIAHDLINMQ